MGIGKPESEITFPISSTIALHATWKMKYVEGHYNRAKDTIIKEINRRTANSATRFVYFSLEKSWVINLINKKNLRLHRVV
jgi:hypothetical protein